MQNIFQHYKDRNTSIHYEHKMRSIFLAFISLGLSGVLLADEHLTSESEETAPQSVVSDENVPSENTEIAMQRTVPNLSPSCKGILLLSRKENLKENPEANSFLTSDMKIPGGEKQLEKRLESLFANREIDSELIADIKNEITQYYDEQKQSLIAVQIPEQKICCGVVQVIICESCLNELTVRGNCWTPSDLLCRYFKTSSQGMIDERILRRDLEFMNRNPFRHVNAILSPGKLNSSTDVTLLVDERRRVRFYAGADNTGVRTTSRQRWYTGLNWGKAFGLDHIFSYQYTSAYSLNEFQAHTAQYQAFLPWLHVLNIYGGYSYVHPHLDFLTTKNSFGQSGQASLRYTIPLMPWTTFTHEFSVGFDFKRTNNTVEFSDLFIQFAKNVNLTQLAVEYRLEKSFCKCRFDVALQGYYSPGNWVPDQTVADYGALRPFARPAYAYFRANINSLIYLPGTWYFNAFLRGQVATQNLLPSEQFCLGGYDTVRGYDQWQLNIDDAVLLNLELRTPQIAVASRRYCVKDALQFLVFADGGYGKNYHEIPGEHTPQYLIGAGPGIRYILDPYITARLDWGVKCHRNKEFTGGNSMVHFNATLSY